MLRARLKTFPLAFAGLGVAGRRQKCRPLRTAASLVGLAENAECRAGYFRITENAARTRRDRERHSAPRPGPPAGLSRGAPRPRRWPPGRGACGPTGPPGP